MPAIDAAPDAAPDASQTPATGYRFAAGDRVEFAAPRGWAADAELNSGESAEPDPILQLPPPAWWPGQTRQVSYPGDRYGPTGVDALHEPEPTGVIDHKPGSFFQRLSLTAAWLNQPSGDDLGATELELYATFALPAPSPDSPLLITPGYNVQYLGGPTTPDLPARLHGAYLQFMWLPQISERWSGVLAVSPGVYSDFERSASESLRIQGRGLARYKWSPTTEVIFGVLYLDRDDVNILASGGIVWAPNADTRYELLFPRPKLAHRICFDGCSEDWWYVSAEFGGDTWAVERASGAEDQLTLRDYRVFLGYERKYHGGAGHLLELGYVFGREIEYRSAAADVELDATVIVRGGLQY